MRVDPREEKAAVDWATTHVDPKLAAVLMGSAAQAKAPIDSNLRMVSEQLFFEVVAERDAVITRAEAAEHGAECADDELGQWVDIAAKWEQRAIAAETRLAERDAALARTVAAVGEGIKLHQYWRNRCVAEAIRATAAEERLARKDVPLIRATRGRVEPWR